MDFIAENKSITFKETDYVISSNRHRKNLFYYRFLIFTNLNLISDQLFEDNYLIDVYQCQNLVTFQPILDGKFPFFV